MKYIITTIVAILMTFSATASDTPNTKITRILVGTNYGNEVFLTISTKPKSTPDCQTNNGYNYVFDGTTETGKMILSLALTAYTANKEVWLAGTGSCTLYRGVENLKHIVVH